MNAAVYERTDYDPLAPESDPGEVLAFFFTVYGIVACHIHALTAHQQPPSP
jgi:hypothetical protein